MSFQNVGEIIAQTIQFLLVGVVINAIFLTVLWRASRVSKLKLKRNEYIFHFVCFNLSVLLMLLMPRLGILKDHYFSYRFFSSLAIVYTFAFSRKYIIRFLKNLFQ